MDDTKADILMMFVDQNGNTLPGESTLQKARNDDFMNGFSCVSDYDDYSNFFEVKNFSFSIKVEPQEQGVGKMSKGASAHHPTAGSPAAAGAAGGVPGATAKGASNDPFERWRSATSDEQLRTKYPVKYDTFSFDRIIDAASPTFFNNCANQVKFRSATLVKRVSRGGLEQPVIRPLPEGEGGLSIGFLRIDFSGVMVTSLSWNDGDMVTENVEMTCDHMVVQYKRQKYAGDVQAAGSATWDRLIHGKATANQGT